MHPVDHDLFALAATQCGLFSRAQVLHRGGSDALIGRRVQAGRWTVVTPGVYGVPGHEPSYRRSVWASWLAGSPRAAVSHWTAGALRGLEGFPRNRFALTVPHGIGRANPIAQVFQTRLPPATTAIGGLPVVSVERLFLDIAWFTGPRKLTFLLDAARTADHTSLVRMRREFLRLAASGRNGISTMRTVLDAYGEGDVPAPSELERHLDAILDRIPVIVVREAPLPGREWSRERVDRRIEHPRRLLVEGDSRRWHTRVADFRRDRERDRVALRAGYPTVRYVYEELVEDPVGVEAELLGLLGISEGSAIGNRSRIPPKSGVVR